MLGGIVSKICRRVTISDRDRTCLIEPLSVEELGRFW